MNRESQLQPLSRPTFQPGWNERFAAKHSPADRLVLSNPARPDIVRVRIEGILTTTPLDPRRMVSIAAGSFRMGDAIGDGSPSERPVHEVYVSAFLIQACPVTKGLWDRIHGWALRNGYEFDNPGAGSGPMHPVHSVNWYDCVKWCNALSEFERRAPAYFTDASQRTPYRQGWIDLCAACVDWRGSGYRLPTEAEWEKAALGGVSGKRFPWGELISHNDANFYSAWNESGPLHEYDRSPAPGYHPAGCRVRGGTTSVGSFRASAVGLLDVVGNVAERCWDWFDPRWYEAPEASRDDTRGPVDGVHRVLRGGSWHSPASQVRLSHRGFGSTRTAPEDRGFRCVRTGS